MSPYELLVILVAKDTQAAQAGVVINLDTRGDDSFFTIWAIGTDGRINSHQLDASVTDEARLKAHVEGFIENHLKAFGGGFAVRKVGTTQLLDFHFCIFVDPATEGADVTRLTRQQAQHLADGNAPQDEAWEVVPFTPTWIEFTVKGPVDTVRYRTTADGKTVQFWSEHNVPGLARQGWNTTRSETVALRARNALKARNP